MASLIQRLLNVLAGKRPGHCGRRASVHLGVEALQDRMLLSASSSIVHSVKEATGGTAVFFHGPDTSLYEKTPSGQVVRLATANVVTDESVGLDPAGHAALFATRLDKGFTLWEFDAGVWHDTKAPVKINEYAAVKGGRLYAEAADNSLWEFAVAHYVTYSVYSPVAHRVVTYQYYTPDRWTQVWGANAVWGLDAVTDSAGNDAVFVQGGDNRLREYTKGAWVNNGNPIDQGSPFTYFSAGLDSGGHACAWTVDTDGYVDRLDVTLGNKWLAVVQPGAILSATTGGVVYAWDQDGIARIGDTGKVHVPLSEAVVTTGISAAAPDDIFATEYAAGTVDLREHSSAGFAWFQFLLPK